MPRPLRSFFAAAVLLSLAGVAASIGADVWVHSLGGKFCHTQLADVPRARAGVVLGCSERLANGRLNLFFRHRIESAAELYQRGSVRGLIVSGDNTRKDYDEPGAIREALVIVGVPRDRIWCDYAGLRTLDSVLRAQRIFGQDAFIVVSQRFHNERAVFLGRRLGLEVARFRCRRRDGGGGAHHLPARVPGTGEGGA